MYLKLNNGIIEKYPYTIGELRRDNPKTSFPANPTNELLAEWNVYPVTQVITPNTTYKQNIAEGTPELVNGEWKQVWVVTDKPNDEVNQIHESLRAEAYRTESDPLFFKAQRGEIEMQVWLNKVAEIKTRFPK